MLGKHMAAADTVIWMRLKTEVATDLKHFKIKEKKLLISKALYQVTKHFQLS